MAIKLEREAPGGKRDRLADILPLRAPLLLQFFPAYACNFKCKYCALSIPLEKRGFISDCVFMDFDLFKKIIDECSSFDVRIRTVRFVGMGEPLMHKNIADMIKYVSVAEISERVEVLTNASLLRKSLSDKIIASGITKLIISIQGTSPEKYFEVCGHRLDWDVFIDNIKYYYDNKRDSKVHIKIVDIALTDPADADRFYEVFGPICDTISIEYANPIYPRVEYNAFLRGKQQTQFGLPVTDLSVCPQPFFSMQINPDGKVVPCYSVEYPEIVGDCNCQSVVDIWSGSRFNNFRRKMLNGKKKVCKACEECEINLYRSFVEDRLDDSVERLMRLY